MDNAAAVRNMDTAIRAITENLLETVSNQYGAAGAPESDPQGHHAFLAYLNWIAAEVESWRTTVLQCIEDPPDVTGNPWPDCICNDARYEVGHMESCPAYGRTPDAPES